MRFSANSFRKTVCSPVLFRVWNNSTRTATSLPEGFKWVLQIFFSCLFSLSFVPQTIHWQLKSQSFSSRRNKNPSPSSVVYRITHYTTFTDNFFRILPSIPLFLFLLPIQFSMLQLAVSDKINCSECFVAKLLNTLVPFVLNIFIFNECIC